MPDAPRGDAATRRVASRLEARPATLCCLLAFGTLAVYAQVLHHDFVNYDDPKYITENRVVQEGLTWAGVRWAFTTGVAGYGHPLTWLSHMSDCQLYGLNPGPHHATSLLLHIANSLLLFTLLHRMTARPWQSVFVAAVFALHPLHVESVAWVAERKDVLCTLFWMLTLSAYVRFVEHPRRLRYGLVLVFFTLGLMAKPMLVTLPFVLLLLDYWPLGRLASVPPDRQAAMDRPRAPPPCDRRHGSRDRALRGLLLEKVPLFALAGASSAVTFLTVAGAGSVTPWDVLPLRSRVTNALVSYATYAGKAFWPTRLAVFYPHPLTVPPWHAMGAAALLLTVSLAVAHAVRRHPYLIVGWCWYLGTLLPVIGLVQVGEHAMADRYTYVPLIGLAVMVAWGLPELFATWRHGRAAVAAAAAAAIVACGAVTWSQVGNWRDSVTLWEHALAVTSDNHVAHLNLGLQLDSQGRTEEAIEHYSAALRIAPDYAFAHNDLGIALKKQGRLAEAIAHYSEALRLKPDYAEAHNNLGVALRTEGKVEQALEEFSEAARIDPDYTTARLNLGITLIELGDGEQAITQLLEVVRLQPAMAEAHYHVANALTQLGQTDRAVVELHEALRLKSDFWEAHNNLGWALAGDGKNDEAIVHYSESLRINPNFALGYYNRARAYEQKGDGEKAETDFARARELDPALTR